MSATSWSPTNDWQTPKSLVPHRCMAGRGLVAMLQLKEVADTKDECDAAYRWLCDLPMDDLTAHVRELEARVRASGKECFGEELFEQVKQGQGSFDLGRKVA